MEMSIPIFFLLHVYNLLFLEICMLQCWDKNLDLSSVEIDEVSLTLSVLIPGSNVT